MTGGRNVYDQTFSDNKCAREFAHVSELPFVTLDPSDFSFRYQNKKCNSRCKNIQQMLKRPQKSCRYRRIIALANVTLAGLNAWRR